MSVSLLLITHANIGRVLLEAAKKTFGELPLNAAAISVKGQDDPDSSYQKAKELIDELDPDSNGVLILTDMFGSTPYNIASKLHDSIGDAIQVISGLNLPMLFRILNYSKLPLDQLTQKAVSGGKDGVIASKSLTKAYQT